MPVIEEWGYTSSILVQASAVLQVFLLRLRCLRNLLRIFSGDDEDLFMDSLEKNSPICSLSTSISRGGLWSWDCSNIHLGSVWESLPW